MVVGHGGAGLFARVDSNVALNAWLYIGDAQGGVRVSTVSACCEVDTIFRLWPSGLKVEAYGWRGLLRPLIEDRHLLRHKNI